MKGNKRKLLPVMKGKIKEGVGAFRKIPTTTSTPSFIRRGNK
jgi:hypothetical protein